ncbi:cation:proton antiporter [Granulosicoccus antarcticus]|uniref:cation:proton antiporter domain-containing protein n=1 Tax=Granulosicoccus antarcticus TaxID=437505 RepID=UPI001F018EBF|nr:cation:proton antiporter [Granulosicoccus antarcticus]
MSVFSSQLTEQGEEGSAHGRLGLAMSVFQDVTAVPFLVVIPVLGTAVGSLALAGALGLAIGKAVLAFALVFFAGRWLLRPLFQLVTRRRSAEVFTLTVLLVALLAAWTTNGLGLSLAFGAFLVGMMLGETEFRFQVESTMRPFRDVLLGLFFVGIGTLIDPGAIPDIWHLAMLGAVLILSSKLLLVAAMVRMSGIVTLTAWRVGLLLAVGGEFGFALLAIALDANVIDVRLGQIALTSVFFSMIGGSVLIRFNQAIATRLSGVKQGEASDLSDATLSSDEPRVLIGGYGRVGHTIAVLLHDSGIAFMAFDTDMKRVEQGKADGHQVMYGDITDPELLATVQVDQASLVILSVDDFPVALQAVSNVRTAAPHVPIIARARDLESSSSLLAAGVSHAYPEMIEASLRLGATALQVLRVPVNDIDLMIQEVRDRDYQPVLEEAQDEKP